ncbi:MAG: dihydropteroate synthase [Gemmataceae bacterium]
MGVVNVTPDSFSDGGRYLDPERAIAHALELAQAGADLLDIGGESTRPGADPVPLEEELRRVLPVIRGLAGHVSIPLSVDTYKAEVARQALAAGATIVNDVTGLTGDPDMPEVVRRYDAAVIVMHMQGTPRTMQLDPHYADVVAEVRAYLQTRLAELQEAGISPEAIAIDPGIGFGKTTEHNVQLLAALERFTYLGRPLCLGVSRKGFINKVLGRSGWVEHGVGGTIGVLLFALSRGALQIARVHDVAEVSAAVRMFLTLQERSDR